MLYLVATPIGNLADITSRAISVLRECDYILCEDTRHSSILLKHYDIHTPLKSFHQFNEAKREDDIIQDLKNDKTIAIISDAGTPGISDPGSQLVKRCVAEGISVSTTPGPCAAIAALTCSGFDTALFQFCGFLPKKAGELKSTLQRLLAYAGTTICYESPHRLLDVLAALQELAPNRRLCVARELTKKFEEFCRGTATDLRQRWKEESPKGELILLIEGAPTTQHDWSTLSPQEHVAWMEENYSLSKQEAIKAVAQLRGVPKREVYNALQKKQINGQST